MEPAGNKEEKMLNYDIGIALGETSIHLASVGDPDLCFLASQSRSISQRYGSEFFPFLIKGVEQT